MCFVIDTVDAAETGDVHNMVIRFCYHIVMNRHVRRDIKPLQTKRNGRNRISREVNESLGAEIVIETLTDTFSICKVKDYSGIDLSQPFCFTAHTDEENSLLCPAEQVPENTTDRNDGWRGFRIRGQPDFSLIGILSGILKILAENEISVFAVSTFNTDYIFVRQEDFQKAIQVLKGTYTVIYTE